MAKIGNLFNPSRINLGEAIPLNTPLVIQMETCGFCNLKCKFCPGGASDSGIIRDMMSFETFKLFLAQCREFPRKIKILRIIGIGEPLLNRNVAEFVSEAKQSGVFEKVEITTNGTLLTRELSDKLIDAGLDTLLVSLEATDENKFEKIAGVRIQINELYENIDYFFKRSRNKCILYIKTTDLALDTESERKAFYEKWGEVCDEIQIEHVYENWPEFQAGTDGNSVRYDLEQYKNKKDVCVQPFKLLCLAANGDVMPCSVDWKRTLLLGNIYQTRIAQIWNGEQLRKLRTSLLRKEICEYCRVCSVTKSNQPDNIDEDAQRILARLEREK